MIIIRKMRKNIIMLIACVCILSGCKSKKVRSENKKEAPSAYTARDLVKLTGYRKDAVKLPSDIEKPKTSSEPTALSIRLKAEHLLMNKGINLKNRSMTEADAKKAGYGSLFKLKAEARKILIKQNKELKPILTGSMVCANAFANTKITVTATDRNTYKKLANYVSKGKKTAVNDDDVKRMLFVSAVVAKEGVTLSKKEIENGESSLTYSSYTGVYKNPAARLAGEKALALYCKNIVK